MAIEFFSQPEESTSLEFLQDALELNPKINGKIFDVFSFKKAKSGKGYMLYTSDFICWFFKKEKPLQQALEALDYYCKTGSGFQFIVQVDKKTKGLFRLGIDTEREVKYVPLENASYLLAQENELEATPSDVQKENPFLFKKQNPSLPTPPIETVISGDTTPRITHQGKKGREVTI